MTPIVTLYGTKVCPGVPPVKNMFKWAKVPYTYVDIHTDEEARARVREINNGFESVPTLIFNDGTTLTEPSAGQLTGKLNELGYTVPLMGRVFMYWPQIFIGAGILFAILRALNVI